MSLYSAMLRDPECSISHTARGALTGLPVWIALASVGFAAMASTSRLPAVHAR